MTEYSCHSCKYNTNNIYKYARHYLSKKHKQIKENEKYDRMYTTNKKYFNKTKYWDH